MLKNYFRVAIRNLKNNRAYSIINIAGLAVGMACFIVIILYVNYELGYDKFNRHAERVYRPVAMLQYNGHEIHLAMCPAQMGPILKAEFPQVVSYTRMRNFGVPVLRYGDKVFSEPLFLDVDSTFFDVFTVHFIEGDPRTALTEPNSVVITKSTATRYFGNVDPMGKILNADRRRNWIVTGVIDDWPQDSHFKFDFLGSLCTYADSRNPTWLSNNYYTYVSLRKGSDPESLQNAISSLLLQKYIGPQLQASVGVSVEQFLKAGDQWKFVLQPLTSIHLNSHLDYELQPNGYFAYIYVFSAIALAILLIACINFINLATARSEKRSKEVGIRKSLGSNRPQLIGQFLTESVLMSLISVVLAIGIVELLLPLFDSVAGEKIGFDLFGNFTSVPLLAGLGIVVGLISGSYPAFYLSSFNPVRVMKSKNWSPSKRGLLRGGLVVFQFVISIILFVGTIVIFKQLRFIQDKNLGFDKEQVVVLRRTDDLGNRIGAFKKELMTDPQVVSVAASTAIPGHQQSDRGYWVEGTSIRNLHDIRQMWCDYSFLKTYGMTLASGRFFSVDHPADSNAIVVNQQAQAVFGFKDLTGHNLLAPGNTQSEQQTFPIIGVVKDFNFQSLHDKIRPLVIGFVGPDYPAEYVSVRIKPQDIPATISFIDRTWKKYAGDEALNYDFLDQDLAHLYVADARTSEIAALFSILAIFIACLGLLGLAAFVTEQRTKEIGIRKVLGASVPEILVLLTSEFAKWVVIANAIAWPAAYLIMQDWLHNFAYQTIIGLWVFAASGFLALIIALMTVGLYTFNAASANPVESLRYE
jgi:putative ABC transport system permease protein